MNEKVYEYKGKPYRIFTQTKTKINGVWIDSVVYEALYDNPDGKFWVRTKEEFFKLFKIHKFIFSY